MDRVDQDDAAGRLVLLQLEGNIDQHHSPGTNSGVTTSTAHPEKTTKRVREHRGRNKGDCITNIATCVRLIPSAPDAQLAEADVPGLAALGVRRQYRDGDGDGAANRRPPGSAPVLSR